MEKVYLVSSDRETLSLTLKAALLSGWIKHSIDYEENRNDINSMNEFGVGDFGSESNPLILPNLNSTLLKRIISFCEFYALHPFNTLPKPLNINIYFHLENNLAKNFYMDFIEVDFVLLSETINVAHFLDIQPCLEICCAMLAVRLSGKSVEELNMMQGIT